MSQFMPENSGSAPQPGVSTITPSNPETTSEDIALMQRVLSAAARNPNLIPADFMAYLLDFIQTSRLSIPIGQVFGFSQFTAQSATSSGITTGPSTSATAAGPTLSGLSAGKYVIMGGFLLGTNGSGTLTVASASMTVTGSTGGGDFAHGAVFTLPSAGDVTSVMAITAGGVDLTMSNVWIIALKFDNP